ncbi:hypothetical protein MRX96_027413 [Rhipicephalus microplus]
MERSHGTETVEWAEKLPRVLSKRRIPVFIFAFIGVLTVAGACLAAVTAVVLYRSANAHPSRTARNPRLRIINCLDSRIKP